MAAAKIAISLPAEVLARIEEVRQATRQTRSEFICGAVEAYLVAARAHIEAEAYARGYDRFPETPEEIAAADRLGAAVLALEPWDPDSAD